jgi:Putative Flp pilus-assembly TadE/G-like
MSLIRGNIAPSYNLSAARIGLDQRNQCRVRTLTIRKSQPEGSYLVTMNNRAASIDHNAWHSNRGSVAIIVAIMLLMLIGFSALGTEVVYAMFKQRQMESTASSAALAGAIALMTGHPTDFTIETRAIATMAGFTNGTAGVTVTINHPPLTGPNTGNSSAVEVIIGQPQTLPLSGMFRAGPWSVTGRAVATQGNSASDCVLALDSGSATGVSMSNGVSVNLSQCGLGVNATGASALSVTGGATLTTKSVSVSGTDTVNGGGTINATNGVKTSQPVVANPYSGTVVPSDAACMTYTNMSQTLSPGVYCGMSIGNGVNVVLSAGVYVIAGNSNGGFSVAGGSTVSGTNVTIVLTGSGSNYATANISNGAIVTLSAPTTGATAGLVFFADPNSPSSPGSTFGGGSQMTLTGALYFPSQTVSYENGTTTTATCTQLIAWLIVFQGGASFNSNCANTGVGTIGASPSKLVE